MKGRTGTSNCLLSEDFYKPHNLGKQFPKVICTLCQRPVTLVFHYHTVHNCSHRIRCQQGACSKCAQSKFEWPVCKTCGKVFFSFRKNFCSKKCVCYPKRDTPVKSVTKNKICWHCRKDFETNKPTQYCSDDCRARKNRQAYQEYMSGKK